ncbi:hypothetical protein BH09MYX1_BH09MYX1_29730 [soil metagenome]
MMPYRFEHAGSFFGPESEDAMSALIKSQLLAVLVDGGESATSMRGWCEKVAADLDQSPDLAGFELWNVFENDSPEPRFTLLYFGDSDSGLLLHAGTAKSAGLALWPEGFKPKAHDGVVTAIDIEALTEACATRYRARP